MPAQTYEITFTGRVGTTLRAEFDDCQVTVGPDLALIENAVKGGDVAAASEVALANVVSTAALAVRSIHSRLEMSIGFASDYSHKAWLFVRFRPASGH